MTTSSSILRQCCLLPTLSYLPSRADGVILVTRSGVSNKKALLRVRDLLLRSGANILGVVRNAVKHPEFHYSYPAEYNYKTSGRNQSSPVDDKVA